MVELAVRQKPLHQVDVFLAGSAGAAERAALVSRDRIRTCLRRLARLVRVTQTLCVWGGGGRQGKGWEGWRGWGEGEIKHGVRISGLLILLSWFASTFLRLLLL